MAATIRFRLRRRLRLLSGAGVIGASLAVLGVGIALVAMGDLRGAVSTVFALASLCLGFALTGWAGSILAGRGFENMQRHLRTGSRWTEQDSRRAMTRIIGFGAGGMLGATLVSITFLP